MPTLQVRDMRHLHRQRFRERRKERINMSYIMSVKNLIVHWRN